MAEKNDRSPLHTAARERKVAIADGLLKTNPKLSQKKDDDGRYAIHWAASSNCLDIVVMLANQSSFDPDVQDGSGWTPLMIAASVPESDDVIKVLLKAGADVNEKSAPPLPFIQASPTSSNLAPTDNGGQTALHLVASKQNLDTARLLLEHKASTRVRDRRGQYPLHRAAAVGSAPMCRLLLGKLSPTNPQDVEGYTPLHHAVAEGHGDAAVALLKEGADPTAENAQGERPLDLAPDKEMRTYILRGAEREGIDLEGQ
ncbi:Ankyrin repeat-containing domain protein [Cordyceps fumosorosea ARSEF 2679]|uniref:Ankyrin repeat-containing domain protein n=1 Tax=Cordyceps fumosorosea (strain ARSEF 2679) TaxID=1081104 RepID=A0A162MM96_CORFA|nr:Ankyrin repeat-containing domain protein [Cordyceps fumosorosea ARSEF 2679]OAA64050.1 Ankyrin repeat-containing domain protein [Cordyceps fumosorosea ARSEF 2679]